jgi:SEC-C motif-containing protein
MCCGPLHKGEREAADANALMRSRYAAFVVGNADYLVRTFHRDHPACAIGEDELRRDLVRAVRTQRFMGLTILDATPPDDKGTARVLFVARVFERGQDLSFVELSSFEHDGTGWRYRDGKLLDAPRDLRSLDGMTITRFEQLLDERGGDAAAPAQRAESSKA